ncbi:DnaD domain protein [Thermodesulfitimonas autotrophica]|uniref:DnaD domain protein n=1 Tax=Thermodesulfitimonas autotrophica TaxID=1894989 RepID=UPI002FE35570
MAGRLNGGKRLVKEYREGNIVSVFGTDLVLSGGIFVPNLLLRFYKKLGISDLGMMIILQIFRLRAEEGRLLVTAAELAEYLTAEEAVLSRELDELLSKKILAVSEYYDGEKVVEGYDFQPLFERLSEVWACAKVAEIQELQALLRGQQEAASTDVVFSELYQAFEKEFGRPLSPIEAEQVLKWRQEMPPALVLEALRRAVLLGKRNFKYIGTILLEWQKNNLRTLAEVEEYDRSFETGRRRKRKAAISAKEKEEKEKKKALIKTLYLS